MVEIAFSTGFGMLRMTIVGRLELATREDHERVQASISDPGIGAKSYVRPQTSFHHNGHLINSNKYRFFPHCLFADKDIGKLTSSVNLLIAGILNNYVFPEESMG